MMSKIALIARVLDHFYPSPPIPLNHFDNFTLLVSVVLSAQTTDGKVNEVTKKLFEIAPNPKLMAKMEASEIQKIIQPVGLAPKKSVYLKGLSQMILDEFGGEVPSTFDSLESLPGVGHKTASVVMSQAFGEAALGVDTHVHRLSLRWGLSKDEKNVNKVQNDLHNLFPRENWNKLHLQMIYFGREYCTAKLHSPIECPMCSWVNKKDGQPAVSLLDFTPKKISKGIIFYAERITELKESPGLARGTILFSPVKSDTKRESSTSSSSLSEGDAKLSLSLEKKGPKKGPKKLPNPLAKQITLKKEIKIEIKTEKGEEDSFIGTKKGAKKGQKKITVKNEIREEIKVEIKDEKSSTVHKKETKKGTKNGSKKGPKMVVEPLGDIKVEQEEEEPPSLTPPNLMPISTKGSRRVPKTPKRISLKDRKAAVQGDVLIVTESLPPPPALPQPWSKVLSEKEPEKELEKGPEKGSKKSQKRDLNEISIELTTPPKESLEKGSMKRKRIIR